MDIQGIGPVKTKNAVTRQINKLQRDEISQKVSGRSQPVQPLNAPQKTAEPVDFQVGAIGTFISEMDLLQNRMLAPAQDEDSPPSLDTLA